jgi:hypothetical protein
MRKFLQFLVLFLLTIALPAGSWFYLKKGEAYQVDMRKELGDYGKLPQWTLPALLKPDTLSSEILVNQVAIIKFLNSEELSNGHEFGKYLKEWHEQFDERYDVKFVLHSLESDSAKVGLFLRAIGVQDPEQVLVTVGAESLAPAYRFPADFQHSVALADTSGLIRKHYDYRDGNQRRRLTEHVLVLMHFAKDPDPQIVREREK